MGADEEVGEGGSLPPLAPPVSHKAFAREKSRFPWQGLAPKEIGRERRVQVFDPIEADRHLGVDNRIDDEGVLLCQLVQALRRPAVPVRMIFSARVNAQVGRVNFPASTSPRQLPM
jgi:hypothetical protein